MLPEGQQLGHYKLVHLLKSGGMGEIHLAEDTILRRPVAIKIVNTDLAYRADADAAKEAIRLFLREAQVVARLDHIHILPLYDSGETIINGIPLMYMVMPFRQKGSLDEWLQKQRQLSLQAIVNIVEQAASALQHAHDHQIIHQDVKPANFLIRGERGGYLDLQLADFGIARLATTTGESQTIRGTPSYIAPEQWEGHPIPATDQYALAVMAYELLAGSVPFQGHQYEVMHKHLHEQPQPPSIRNPHIPVSIDAVLLRALAKNPADRFLSISAFARAFHLALYDSGDVHITLTLTPLEAQIGCRSILVLPDGRKIAVDVPAGARHNQVIRFRGLGNQGYGGRSGALVLTIAIGKVEEVTLANANTLEKTLPALPAHHDTLPPPRRPRHTMSQALPLITVALFILMSIAGLFYFAKANAENAAIATATATTQAKHTTAIAAGGTATQQVHLSATAASQIAAQHASATTSAATATVTVQTHLTATASATTATAIAQANLSATQAASTATAAVEVADTTRTASAATIAHGTKDIDDPLQDNGGGYKWDEINVAGGGGCAFTGGTYSASMPQKGMMSVCMAQNTSYTNFSYQIQMKLVKGDQGGIVFCADSSQGNFYYFHIANNGTYGLEMYKQGNPFNTLSKGTNPSLVPRSDQTYLIAAIVNAGAIDLYVNDQPVTSVTDRTFSRGQIGVAAENITNTTEATFSHVQVWSR